MLSRRFGLNKRQSYLNWKTALFWKSRTAIFQSYLFLSSYIFLWWMCILFIVVTLRNLQNSPNDLNVLMEVLICFDATTYSFEYYISLNKIHFVHTFSDDLYYTKRINIIKFYTRVNFSTLANKSHTRNIWEESFFNWRAKAIIIISLFFYLGIRRTSFYDPGRILRAPGNFFPAMARLLYTFHI